MFRTFFSPDESQSRSISKRRGRGRILPLRQRTIPCLESLEIRQLLSTLTIPSGIVASPGDTVHVPVSVDDAAGLMALDVSIAYSDTTKLDLANADVKLGSLLAGWTPSINVNDAAGTARIAAFTITPITSGSGTLLDLAFHIPASATAGTISLSFQKGDLNEAPATLVNGSIQIQTIHNIAAANDSYSLDQDSSLSVAAAGVLANDSDSQGDPLTALLESGPASGTLILNANGSFTYTPNAGFHGTDTFTYRASDGAIQSDPATVSLIVRSVSHIPQAINDSYTLLVDSVLNVTAPGVLANDVDAQSHPLTAALVDPPAHGTLTLNADGSLSYTPAAGYVGPDQFSYTANDGITSSNPAIVNIVVQDQPSETVRLSIPTGLKASRGQAIHVPIMISDAAGLLGTDLKVTYDSSRLDIQNSDVLPGTLLNPNWQIIARVEPNAAEPTLSQIKISAFSIAPIAGGAGSLIDLVFHVRPDAAMGTIVLGLSGQLNEGQIAATIIPGSIILNDAPTAANDAYDTDEDKPLIVAAPGILGNDVDADGDKLSAALVEAPTHGTLNLKADGSFTYTPAANFHGTDTFTYKAGDGALQSGLATVTITVKPVNDIPTAAADNYSVDEDTVLKIAAPGVLGNDSDADGQTLTAQLVTGPSHGTLALKPDGSFEYTPAVNYNGADSFTYKASDGSASSAAATVNIDVKPVNDAPIAKDDVYSTDEDTPITIPAPGVLANDSDPDGDPIEIVPIGEPPIGTLTLNTDGSFTYTPPANFFGSETFTYQITDGTSTAEAKVTINVNPVNDRPVAGNDAYTVDEDNKLTIAAPGILANDTDVEASALTPEVVAPPANGTLVLSADGSFEYTPSANFNGADSFTYRVSDGALSSEPATVAITVKPVNDAPVAKDDTYSTDEDTPLTIPAPGVLANDSDVDGDPLTVYLPAGTPNGSLALNPDGSFTYTPNANFFGIDSIPYKVTDGKVDSTATLTIDVKPVNDLPVAANDAYSVNEDTSLNIVAPGILANDDDVETSTLAPELVAPPTHGLLKLNADGSFEYTPNANFNGADSFTYRVSDGALSSEPATVAITVKPVNDAPVARADAYSVGEGSLLVIAAPGLLANDSDADGDSLTATLVAGPANGALTLQPDGSFTYQPQAGFMGLDSFTYRISDGQLDSEPATVSLNVKPSVITITGDRDRLNENDVIRLSFTGANTLQATIQGQDKPATTNTYSLDAVRKIVVTGLGGDDRIILDFQGGQPVLADGLWALGGTGVDRLMIQGTERADTAEMTASQIIFNGLSINCDMEGAQFDTYGGDDRLVIQELLPFSPSFNGGSGSDTLQVLQGAYDFYPDAVAGTLNLFVILSQNSTGQFHASQRIASLRIDDSARASFVASGGVIYTNSLTIAPDAALDLGRGSLGILSTPAACETVLGRVNAMIRTGRNGGLWNGNGITSSAAAATPDTGLAVLMNKDESGTIPIVDGQPLIAGVVYVKYTYNGDMNLDGSVNADDYFRIDSGFLERPVPPQYRNGDLNFDGKIDADDYFLIDQAFLNQKRVTLSAPKPAAAAAPAAKKAPAARSLFSRIKVRKSARSLRR